MSNLVEINNTELGIKEFNGQRVVTFKDIDTVHSRPTGTARKAFNRNKDKFILGQDYFVHDKDDTKILFGIKAPNGLTSVTEFGYLMIVKVFDDDLSWNVQRELVSVYFKAKSMDDNRTMNLQPLVDTLTTAIASMQQDISELKESTKKKSLPEKKYSRWKTNTFKKLNILHDFVNEHSEENLSLPNIIHLVIGETEDTYRIEINDYMELYKSEYDLDTNPYAIDVINHYKDIRDMFTLTLDTIMDKLHIGDIRKNLPRIYLMNCQKW